jgi:hypothetical protein
VLWQQIFLDFGAADFLFNIPLKKVLQNRRFSPLARNPVLELQFV